MTIELRIPDEAWENNEGVEPEGSRLLTTVEVNSIPMHFEAWEISGEDGEQEHLPYPEDLETLITLTGGAGFYEWLIGGRRYIIIATPFCT